MYVLKLSLRYDTDGYDIVGWGRARAGEREAAGTAGCVLYTWAASLAHPGTARCAQC